MSLIYWCAKLLKSILLVRFDVFDCKVLIFKQLDSKHI